MHRINLGDHIYAVQPADVVQSRSLSPESERQRQGSPQRVFSHGPLQGDASAMLPSVESRMGSPNKQRLRASEERVTSPSTSPKKQPPGRKGSIWDNLFHVDVTYQKSRN